MDRDQKNLKQIIAYEKSLMLPWNYKLSYILTPIYVGISCLLILAFVVFMAIDEDKYLIHGLSCMGVLVVITIAFLSCVPIVRRIAIRTEIDRYNFDTSDQEALEVYDFSDDEFSFSLQFDQNGMILNDILYYYNHLDKVVMTSNYCNRVEIFLRFTFSEDTYASVPLNPTSLKMLECFDIELENEEVLNYILENKEAAFEQIYKLGRVGSLLEF